MVFLEIMTGITYTEKNITTGFLNTDDGHDWGFASFRCWGVDEQGDMLLVDVRNCDTDLVNSYHNVTPHPGEGCSQV